MKQGGINMLNRALIWLNDEINVNIAIESGKNLEKRYGCAVDYLYIKESAQDYEEKVCPSFGVGYLIANKLKEHDQEVAVELGHLIKEQTGKDMRVIAGEILEVLSDEMKYYDLMIFGRRNHISSINKEILKHHYKPIILLGKKPIDFNFITFANDNSTRSNKSLFSFMGIFNDLNKIDSVSINLVDDAHKLDAYMETAGITFTKKEFQGDIFETLKRETEKSGIIICGNLGHSYMYEKITKDEGFKIISELEPPIFIR